MLFCCLSDGLLTIGGKDNGPPFVFARFGGSPGGAAVVPLFGLLRTMAAFSALRIKAIV